MCLAKKDSNSSPIRPDNSPEARFVMTLKPYNPDMLDQFALKLLDLASQMREMANRSREYEIGDFTVHDKKAREWHANMERWMRKSRADLEMKIIEVRAAQRALSAAD